MAAKVMRLKTFKKRMDAIDLPLPNGSQFAGVDPVTAGKMLGMSRQGVHKAIERGDLEAYRVVSENDPAKTLFIVVTSDSIEGYRFVRKHRKAG